jgi:hypothetical protein
MVTWSLSHLVKTFLGVHTATMQNFITIGYVVYEHIEDKQTNTHAFFYIYRYLSTFFKKTPSYNLIPEKDDSLKKDILVLPEYMKNKNFVKKKSPCFTRILEK